MSPLDLAALLIGIGALLVLQRVVLGPTIIDRILGVNVLGTKTIVLLVLVGFLAGRPDMFVDIALAYALINFIATIAVLRYLEGLSGRPPADAGGGPSDGGGR
jgi:multicomponent Na+:H+ antiporter subunit F